MKRVWFLSFIPLAWGVIANGQGRPVDWTSYGGDAQHSGWEKSDSRITKDNVKDFQLVLKRKLENGLGGPRSLTPPVVVGTLISYRGFKELAFVAGNSGGLWAIDADLDRMFWHKQLDANSGVSSGLCSGVTAMPSLVPPVNFGARARGGGGARPPGAGMNPTAVAGPNTTTPPARPARQPLGAGGFGAARPIFAVSRDGKLHRLNTSTGDDQEPAVDFLPPGAKASVLTLADGTIYTTTSGGCGGAPNAVWALDLASDNPKPASFKLESGEPLGLGGLALGTDDTIYVQSGSGRLVALSPKELKLTQYFEAPKGSAGALGASPVVFAHNGKDLVVSAGTDGRLYLLDAAKLGGDDHKTPLFRTEPVSSGSGGIWGGLSSWQDADNVRWVAAPVWGAAGRGSVVAFKLEEQNGKPALTRGWVSQEMSCPEPPVVTSGVLFALSAGEYGRDGRPVGSSHATLYALDAATGKEIYSTGTQVNAHANLTGMTVVNGRVYFTTTDNTLYAFGIFLER